MWQSRLDGWARCGVPSGEFKACITKIRKYTREEVAGIYWVGRCLDWAGETVCRYQFYECLFSLLSFWLVEERSPIMSLFQNSLRLVFGPSL